MDWFSDTFEYSDERSKLIEKLTLECPEFNHLIGTAMFAIRGQNQPRLHGAPCHAFISLPRVQGPLAHYYRFLGTRYLHEGAEEAPPEGQPESMTEPDFLIIYDGPVVDTWPALKVESLFYHELCHIKQKEDEETGAPKFDEETGQPRLIIVPHDTEVFDGEIRRYGPELLELEQHLDAVVDGQKATHRRLKVVAR